MDALAECRNTLIAIGFGIGLFVVGNLLLSRFALRRGPPGKFAQGMTSVAQTFIIVGLCLSVLGVLAGFFGSFDIGPVTLEAFPFAPGGDRARKEAAAYAKKHMEISSTPAIGWHGASKKVLEYTVVNKGDRHLSRLILRFRTGGSYKGVSKDVPLHGPFPAHRKVKTVVEVPPGTKSSYFQPIDPVEPSHIAGGVF